MRADRRRPIVPEPLEARALFAADLTPYATGTPTLTDVWVDPLHGSDSNTGAARGQALQSLAEAWNRVPSGQPLTGTGYRIQLVAGDYPAALLPANGWTSDRHGTASCPVEFNAADGLFTVRVHGTLNCQNDSYLYMIGLSFVTDRGGAGGGNVVQLASDDHVLLRSCKLDGFDGTTREPQETLKANQCRYVYVESCDVGGAFWFGLDFVAVEYGHVLGSRVHDTGDDGLVLKGGTADVTVAGTVIEDVGNVGFAAGQGSGFEFMVAPWLHYEAYDLKFVNNVIRDVQNAGMAVRGGYNILLADNTLYRVGLNQDTGASLLLFSPGDRSCDGDAATAQAHHDLGGWGPTTPGDAGEMIPNRNVYVYDNVVDNPAGSETLSPDLTVFAPVTPPPGLNIPSPVLSDDNLQIHGNILWNGTPGHDLGANDPSTDAAIRSDNAVGLFEPRLVDPAGGDFRPVPGGNVATFAPVPIPDFTGGDLPASPRAPQGDLSNVVAHDWALVPRSAASTPGAFVAVATAPPPPDYPCDILMHIHNGQPYPVGLTSSSSTPAVSAGLTVARATPQKPTPRALGVPPHGASVAVAAAKRQPPHGLPVRPRFPLLVWHSRGFRARVVRP